MSFLRRKMNRTHAIHGSSTNINILLAKITHYLCLPFGRQKHIQMDILNNPKEQCCHGEELKLNIQVTIMIFEANKITTSRHRFNFTSTSKMLQTYLCPK
ncbi:hypothetical protein ERO13_D05G363840v2 [Gossypium hirsutum]|nr:hypothetical protein ERO13_D05G363840v2 [Gossypium hirsutum]